ncbi:MAG: ribosome-associated translation inhibitor RaiA [Pseudomonadota bacterium]
MQLSVKGKQLDVGDALRTHVSDVLSRTLEKYFGDAVDVGVTVTKDAHLYRTSISAHVGRGIHMEAHGENEDAYRSFDRAADHLATRLRRHKRRLREHDKEMAASIEAQIAQQYILSPGPDGDDLDDSDEESTSGGPENDQPIVIAEMETEILSLTVSEAVMRLDLSNGSAIMFRNSAHGGLNMLYRRQDGNIGWIDPRGNKRD